MNGAHACAVALLAVLLGACSFAPHYKTPDSVPVTSAYAETGDWMAAQPADGQSRGAWWSLFPGSAIGRARGQGRRCNQDVKAAFARLQQARAEPASCGRTCFPRSTPARPPPAPGLR